MLFLVGQRSLVPRPYRSHAMRKSFFSQADQRKEEEQQPPLVQPLWHVIKLQLQHTRLNLSV